MKTIQFKTQDQTLWVININQITTLFQMQNGNGTFVRLSCGKELHTMLSYNQILEDIKRQVEN
jgi:hypothetical protein